MLLEYKKAQKPIKIRRQTVVYRDPSISRFFDCDKERGFEFKLLSVDPAMYMISLRRACNRNLLAGQERRPCLLCCH